MAHVDQAVLLKQLERLADGSATNIELGRERRFSGQPIARLETLTLDQRKDLHSDLQGEWAPVANHTILRRQTTTSAYPNRAPSVKGGFCRCQCTNHAALTVDPD